MNCIDLKCHEILNTIFTVHWKLCFYFMKTLCLITNKVNSSVGLIDQSYTIIQLFHAECCRVIQNSLWSKLLPFDFVFAQMNDIPQGGQKLQFVVILKFYLLKTLNVIAAFKQRYYYLSSSSQCNTFLLSQLQLKVACGKPDWGKLRTCKLFCLFTSGLV